MLILESVLNARVQIACNCSDSFGHSAHGADPVRPGTPGGPVGLVRPLKSKGRTKYFTCANVSTEPLFLTAEFPASHPEMGPARRLMSLVPEYSQQCTDLVLQELGACPRDVIRRPWHAR